MKLNIKYTSTFALLLISITFGFGQAMPGPGENIAYLMTFGKDADITQGDDDHVQTFFILIPSSHRKPFFIRVFDPDVGGAADESTSDYNTKVRYSVFGGKGAFTNKAARSTNPDATFDSGNLLASKTFGESRKYDYKWYTFGPFNPSEGEYIAQWQGKVFKIIAEGLEGDDGNAYKYFISTHEDINKQVEGANLFTFEYTFRLQNDAKSTAHIYPYIDNKTIAIEQSNFDFDTDGEIRLNSVAKLAHPMAKSADGQWVSSKHQIVKEEQGGSIDIEIHKEKLGHNNITFYLKNQYDEAMPFFAIPIGGVPKYQYDIDIMYHGENVQYGNE